jgi:hypothetical protein
VEADDLSMRPARSDREVHRRGLARFGAALGGWLSRDWLALLLFTLAALAVLAPIMPALRSRVVGWPGENVQYAYMTGWMSRALLLGQSPFVDPRLNYPDTLLLTATDVPYVSNLLVAPFAWLLGPTFAYNLIILLSFVFSGYFTYLWILRLTGSRAGGLIAGLAFLLAPYRIAESYGHLQMVCTYALPLFFWALDQALEPPTPTWRALLLLAGATWLVGGASQYYLVICLVCGASYTLLSALPRLGYLLYQGWRLLAGVAIGAVASALPYFSALRSDLYTTYQIADTRIWSVDPLNFILPARLHPLWGSLVERMRPEHFWIEKTLYIGVVAGLLALLALIGRDNPQRRRSLIWLGVAIVAAVFALGTDLHINNQPLQADAPFWLPAYYFAHLPFIGFMRAWSRFGIIVVLFVALLAGMGAVRIAGWARWPHAALVLVGALLVLDLLPGTVESSSLAPRPIDRWLAQQPGDFAVAVLPARDSLTNYQAAFGSLFNGKYLTAYNHPEHIPSAYSAFAERAATFPDARSIHALHGMGLRYLLLEKRLFDGAHWPAWGKVEAALAHSSEAQIVADVDDVVVVGFR